MNDRRWYVADALVADLTDRHHHIRATSEEEVERRMRERYPEAVAILVRRKRSRRQILGGLGAVPLSDNSVGRFPPAQ